MTDLAEFIRDVPDFPKPGILFRDITPLLASPQAFGDAIDCFGGTLQVARDRRGSRSGIAWIYFLALPWQSD